MIEIKNLNKSFGSKHVIKNMNLKLEKGTIFGLIGINGAGKSTLLRLLSGVLNPDSGEIFVDEKLINEESKKKIFYLSDNPPYTSLTKLVDIKELYETFYDFDNQIFEEIIEIFKLPINEPISKFSKGMRRQGYIALAFATKASYLLFDEVFDGLDPQARLKFKQFMINNINSEQIIIITSHSLRELEDICDTFGMIDGGYFKRYGQIDFELNKLKKYQIVLKELEKDVFIKQLKCLFKKQEGRVLTIITEELTEDINNYLDKNNYLVIDELSISFEEYFIVTQEENKK
ncbi:ABC transporter ATP-binding protein [Haploplasma axanthum]|nr:ABC transporter ATP-binding protein [Haploplasma axanthum]